MLWQEQPSEGLAQGGEELIDRWQDADLVAERVLPVRCQHVALDGREDPIRRRTRELCREVQLKAQCDISGTQNIPNGRASEPESTSLARRASGPGARVVST